MSIYTSEIMEGAAVACSIAKRYDLYCRAHSAPTIVVSGAHSVTTSTRSRRRSAYIVDQYVETPHPYQRLPIAFSVSNATIHASVSSKVEQQYLGVFDSSEL